MRRYITFGVESVVIYFKNHGTVVALDGLGSMLCRCQNSLCRCLEMFLGQAELVRVRHEKRGEESRFVGFCIASVLSHSYYMNRTTRYEFINIMLDALSVRYKGD